MDWNAKEKEVQLKYGLRTRPDIYSSLMLAKSAINKYVDSSGRSGGAGWAIMRSGSLFYIVTMSDAAKLERNGFEWIRK